MKKKIVFVVSALHGGGAERVTVLLADELSKEGFDVTILMIAGTERAYDTSPPVKVISLSGKSSGNPLIKAKRLISLRKYIRENKDAYFYSLSTSINLQALIACAGLSVKLAVSERNDPARCSYRRFRDLVYSAGALWGAKFIFQTGDAAAYFGNNKRIRANSSVIPNPVSLPKGLAPIERPRSARRRIAAVGRLEDQKNYPLLLRAFAEFYGSNKDWQLSIYGKGTRLEALRELAGRLGIDSAVIFEGFCPDVLQKIKEADIFVMSSDYEGMPNALMEAMALGLPCIATDCPIGGPAMLIESGGNGLLTKVGDCEELAGAMERLSADEELAARLSERALLVNRDYNVEIIAKKWLSVFDE